MWGNGHNHGLVWPRRRYLLEAKYIDDFYLVNKSVMVFMDL